MGSAPAPPTPRLLRKLTLRSFRNLDPLELEPGPRVNVFHGDNGAGKSNLLEAIHYLSALRSFRGARTDDLVGREAAAASLGARWSGRPLDRQQEVLLRRDGPRKLALDGKRPRSIAAWHTAFPLVLFHAGDLALASGPAEPRRTYLDRILEELDPTYATALASYQKALRSRNRLLKAERADRAAITVYDRLLASSGEVVGKTRARLVDDLAPLTEAAFAEVSGGQFPLAVRYRPRVEPRAEAIEAALNRSFDKDRARGFTGEGPHGDDLALEVAGEGGPSVRHHASQGQHRAIALSLKISELEVLARRSGWVPPLLLDDVSSELDRTRNRRLFERLATLGGQVFLTTTHPQFILVDQDRRDFQVRLGVVDAAAD